MDEKIRRLEKQVKTVGKELKTFESEDKKRDKFVAAGKKALKGKKK